MIDCYRARPIGDLLRHWRARQSCSQLALALRAGVSPRHLSFVETGRAHASSQLLLRLAEALVLSHAERNTLLAAGGYAPLPSSSPRDDPERTAVRHEVDRLLHAHEPVPALAIDRHWNLIAMNRPAATLMGESRDMAPGTTVNVIRQALDPAGLAGRIVNAHAFSASLAIRLRREVDLSGDSVLAALLDEIETWRRAQGWPSIEARGPDADAVLEVAVPLRIATDLGILSFLGTTTVLGTATDIAVPNLTIESFFPLDSFTREALAGHS
jgi:transcriptional regulator with XRE-family HTH domain